MDYWKSRFDLDGVIQRLSELAPELLVSIFILTAFWLAYRLTRAPGKALLRRVGFHETLIRMLVDNVYRFGLMGLAIVMAADQMGINVAAALAGLGIVGIAVGFAAQDSLANVISGFVIFLDKPFQVGDVVRVAEQYGEVREITMRTTRIRTRNNTYVVIPNKKIIDEVLVNYSKHGEARVDVTVGVAYKETIPHARRVILDAVEKIPAVMHQPAPEVVVKELGASGVDLEVRVWIHDAVCEPEVHAQVTEASKLALDRAGIEIPYHHLQLFVENVSERVWEDAAAKLALAARSTRR